jgi:Tripartite tricarboxylate transporter TctB family
LLRKRIELIVSLLIVAVLAWALWESRAWPPQSRLFPWSIGITVLCLAFVQLGISVRNAFRSEPSLEGAVFHNLQPIGHSEESSRFRQGDVDRTALRHRVTSMQGWIVIFFLGIWLLGFKVGALVLTWAFLKLAAHERWRISAAFAVMSYLFFLIVFDFALEVPLGAGLIADYFELNSLDMYLVRPFLTMLK